MYTVEFETDSKERIIEIPPEFEAFASKHLKVMLSFEECNNDTHTNPIKRVSAMSIDTREFKFDREEANTR
jgi:hypothetical protein